MEKDTIAGNLEKLLARIEKKCVSVGRNFEQIKIVGVSKTVPAQFVREAVLAGLKECGENRVPEGIEKIKAVSPRPIWHFVGHLQRNKARKATEYFDVIQTVDSPELAEIISKRILELDKEKEIYLQLNSTGESQKSGFNASEILDIADKINKLRGLKLTGLMTIGPFTENETLIRRSFSLTNEVFDKLKGRIGGRLKWLSMGMSGDFEIALDYGANVLRIGTAIFGPRNKF
ncbi:MAG: YggS family pyridoxal phosphate-dependent enzyme [Candidatus Zixiibacteriota bacterium]|nr:MAG: YggS family pyridoxal phosphate-dependent enzyme [candidate division Zixibacteria bacterium]